MVRHKTALLSRLLHKENIDLACITEMWYVCPNQLHLAMWSFINPALAAREEQCVLSSVSLSVVISDITNYTLYFRDYIRHSDFLPAAQFLHEHPELT